MSRRKFFKQKPLPPTQGKKFYDSLKLSGYPVDDLVDLIKDACYLGQCNTYSNIFRYCNDVSNYNHSLFFDYKQRKLITDYSLKGI